MGRSYPEDLPKKLGDKKTLFVIEDDDPMVFIDQPPNTDDYYLRVEYLDVRIVATLPKNVKLALGQVKEVLDGLPDA